MSTTTYPEIMTLEEVASYLRLPLETIEQSAQLGQIPGRKIGDTWRFLKSALHHWLGYPNGDTPQEQVASEPLLQWGHDDMELNGAKTAKKRLTANDLLNSDLIGLWAERTDLPDSVTYARQLREQAQRRHSS